MPSRAFTDFDQRLSEVQQLLDAHSALTRLRNAEAALRAGGQTLQNVAEVVQHLVSEPRRGRPREVQALNSAGIALLSAHLQGFFSDLFDEVARATLDGKVGNTQAVIDSANKRGNPNEENITRLFNSIGYAALLDGVSWQRMNNKQMKAKLRALNELRNKIVHGSPQTVAKSTLKNYLAVMRTLAEKVDEKLRREVRGVTGADPW